MDTLLNARKVVLWMAILLGLPINCGQVLKRDQKSFRTPETGQPATAVFKLLR